MTEAFLREQYSPALFYPEFSPVDFWSQWAQRGLCAMR